MTRKKRALSQDEQTLWTVVTRSIKPLRRRKPAKPEDIEKSAIQDVAIKDLAVKDLAIKDLAIKDLAVPSRSAPSRQPAKMAPPAPSRHAAPPALAPLGRRLKQKIGRGSEPIDARIDLHGMTQASAHSALAHFLRRAQHDGARVVLVITGKGKAGADPHAERGVLKRQVPLWLESPELRGLVVGYEAANIGHGGAGALYVRMRKTR